jgi:hypothetical protein
MIQLAPLSDMFGRKDQYNVRIFVYGGKLVRGAGRIGSTLCLWYWNAPLPGPRGS